MSRWQVELFLRGMTGYGVADIQGTINSNWKWYNRGQATMACILVLVCVAVPLGLAFMAGVWSAKP